MKKKVGIIKKRLAVLLIIAMSINSFGAIVSDNDGSAFITKAEFDALKSSFQSQIDSYNTSIDSKIDGAIAAYLEGIRIDGTITHEILVDNYSDIRWFDKHKMKLQSWEWTDKSTKVKHDASYVEPVYENHRNVRNAQLYLYDEVYNDYGTAMFTLLGRFAATTSEAKIHYYAISYVGSEGHAQEGIPVLFIRCKKDDTTGKYYVDGIFNEPCMHGQMLGLPHKAESSSNWWYVIERYYNFNSWRIDNPNSGEYFRYYVYMKRNGYSSYISATSVMTPDNTWFGGSYGRQGLASSAGMNGTTALNDSYGAYIYPKTFQWTTSADQQAVELDNLKYMMFGTDSDPTVNIQRYYTSINICDGNFYDYTASETVNVPIKFTEFAYHGGIINSTTPTGNNINPSADGTLYEVGYPLFERASMRTLTSGAFVNNGTDLTYGSGLPIAKKFDPKETVNIDFDYAKINSEYAGAAATGTEIKVSLKKSDYTTPGGTDYWVGSVNGGTIGPIQDVVVTGGHVTITFDGKEEPAWLRITPNTNNGIYAKISDLLVVGKTSY